jgi:hypothetical protein
MLPDYAKPKQLGSDPAALDGADTIEFRVLGRVDFKGSSPPPQFGEAGGRLKAATCAYLRSSPDLQIAVIGTGEGRYEASVRNLHFFAIMDRGCSWWNPRQDSSVPASYVLQHEQIHFAIMELQARRMNAQVEEIAAAARATDSSADGARRACEAQLSAALQSHVDQALEVSTRFDEDTSMGGNERRQNDWYRRVHDELRRLAR